MSDDRKNRMKERFNTRGTEEDVNVVNNVNNENDVNDGVADSGTSEDDEAQDSPPEEKRVRDTVGRTFYVGEETLGEIDSLYKEMDFRYDQEFDEDLPKNKVFYPAMFRAVVNRTTIEEELGLDNG